MKLSQINNPALNEGLQGFESGSDFLVDLLPRVIGLAFVVGVIVFLFIILIGGIQWISSGGDKAGIEAARGKILNAVVGLIVLFAALAILSFLGDFFGLDLLDIQLGPLQIGIEPGTNPH